MQVSIINEEQPRWLAFAGGELDIVEMPTGMAPIVMPRGQLAPHLAMPSNRPNSVITMKSLNPATLGALLALYEHRTFCSGQLWRINSFDQWGIELGKEISTDILGRLTGAGVSSAMDPSTERLIKAWKQAQG